MSAPGAQGLSPLILAEYENGTWLLSVHRLGSPGPDWPSILPEVNQQGRNKAWSSPRHLTPQRVFRLWFAHLVPHRAVTGRQERGSAWGSNGPRREFHLFRFVGNRHPFSKPQSPLFERGLLLLGLGGHPGGAQTASGWSPRSPPTPQLTLASLTPLHMATANARLKTPSEGQPASWGRWDSTTGHPGGQPGQDRTKEGGQKNRANERTTGVGGRREARRLGFKRHA